MAKQFAFICFICILMSVGFFSVNKTLAETISGSGSNGTTISGSGDNTTNSGSSDTVSLKNPLENAGVTDVPTLIGKIIDALLGIVGSLALIMFIYGGFTWMLAAGNDSKVEKGRNILAWAVVGLVVIFASYSIVHFILKSVVQ